MRVLAVDPGEKRLGVAISDPTGTLARPLSVIKHVNRSIDAQAIVHLAIENNAERIIVGQALDDEGVATPQSQLAGRLVETIRSKTHLPVELWDESGSTQAARANRIELNVSRRKRRGHLDDLAAAIILQSYLDAHAEP